jgi:hypothetical protein
LKFKKDFEPSKRQEEKFVGTKLQKYCDRFETCFLVQQYHNKITLFAVKQGCSGSTAKAYFDQTQAFETNFFPLSRSITTLRSSLFTFEACFLRNKTPKN